MTSQLSLFEMTSFEILPETELGYKLALYSNGVLLCRFHNLEIAVLMIKDKLSKQGICYKQKMLIIDETIKQFRVVDDKKAELEREQSKRAKGYYQENRI